MSYYKIIAGKKMDAQLIDTAAQLVCGQGDGRLSMKDAEQLLKLATDGNIITDVERNTIDYLFRTFRWTANASDWFMKELRAWEAQNLPKTISLSDLSEKHFAGADVLKDQPSQAARKHALEAATNETSSDHDDIGLWIRLSDGTTVEVFSNFIELEDEYVQLRGGCIVPVRAIEKVEI